MAVRYLPPERKRCITRGGAANTLWTRPYGREGSKV